MSDGGQPYTYDTKQRCHCCNRVLWEDCQPMQTSKRTCTDCGEIGAELLAALLFASRQVERLQQLAARDRLAAQKKRENVGENGGEK